MPAICVAAYFGMIFLIANIPGSPVIGPSILSGGKYGPGFGCDFETIIHGWPLTCLQHEWDYAQSTDNFSPWDFGVKPQIFVVPLLINITLLISMMFTVGWVVHRRTRKNGRWIKISDIILVLLCLVIAWKFYVTRSRLHDDQIAFISPNIENTDHAEWQPFGPYWLRLMTGPEYWEWGDLLAAVDVWHSNDISRFPGKNSIKVLRIWTVKCDAMPALDQYDNLLAIDMSMVNYDYSTFEGDGDPDFWPCLQVIAGKDSIQGLNLYNTGVTDRGLKELSRMPNLKNLELADNSEVTDNGLKEIASIKSLKRLSMGGNGVTEAGVKKLRKALPSCEILWNP